MNVVSQSRRLAFALAILLLPMMPASAADSPDALPEILMEVWGKGDFATARQILEPLAGSSNTDAQNLLGILYMRGDGVPQNPREAARLFRLSADHGNKRSQFQLARLLLEGVGIEKDEVEAFRYFEMSARQGFALAQLTLGNLLSPGQFEGDAGMPGVLVSVDGTPPGGDLGQRIPKDAVTSGYWFRMAADQGNPEAQFSLGLAYSEGLGAPFNRVEGVRLYRLAAKQGHSGAQHNLGLLYAKGEGVSRDHLKAYMWFIAAAASGSSKANGNREIASNLLTPRQRAQAEQMAARCVETQFAACD